MAATKYLSKQYKIPKKYLPRVNILYKYITLNIIRFFVLKLSSHITHAVL